MGDLQHIPQMIGKAMKICKILFTWSWEGFVVEYENGLRSSYSRQSLFDTVGQVEYDRLSNIAARLYGHWQTVE